MVKKLKLELIGIFVVVILGAVPALAVPLTHWNITELNVSGDYVNVNIGSDISGNTTLTVRWISGNSTPPTGLGIDKFGYNSTASVLSCASGWICGGTNQEMDGFGSFGKFERDPGSTGGITNNIVFVLRGTANFFANDHGSTFAAHVRYTDNCSGFVSNGTTTSGDSNTNCGGSTSVPEPSSLLLLGSGLVGLGLWGILFKRKRV